MKKLVFILPLMTLSFLASCNNKKPEPKRFGNLCFTAEEDNSTVAYSVHGDLDIDIEISYDENVWSDWNGDEITLNTGKKIYVRNTKSTLSRGFTSDEDYFSFDINNGGIAASGNVMSMINYASLSESCFANMFYYCYNLTTPPELPATTLAISCYNSMFEHCINLQSAPVLPSSSLALDCYNSMFEGCSSLIHAPALPATTLAEYCYHWMFYDCTALISPPNLPASELKNNCYQLMFYGCKDLKIRENGEGTEFFTCPDTSPEYCVYNMFGDTGGDFKGAPTEGETYYWYQ